MALSPRFLLTSAVVLTALVAVACQAERPEIRSVDATEQTPAGTIREPAPEPETRAVSADSRMLMIGTVFWGRFMEDWSDASPRGERFPFHRLGGFDRDEYDAWIAGLECPTVAGDRTSSAEQDRLLSFNCDPRFLDEAARWFTAFSLANNHADNRGQAGLQESRRQLREHGIQAFGDPDPDRLDRLCEVVTVPADVRRDDGTTTGGQLPIALCGYHGVFKIPTERALQRLSAYAELLPTFAFPHSGLEYVATPDGIKTDLYRGLIDHGADAVLGDHPHWIQRAEAYKGRLIAYSLGNFMFDQQHDVERTRAASIDVRMEVIDDGHLDEWLELGRTCQHQQGDCLDDIRAAHLPEMPFTLEYDAVGSANPQRVTRPATPAEQRAILDRLDWEDAMAGLRGRQSAAA